MPFDAESAQLASGAAPAAPAQPAEAAGVPQAPPDDSPGGLLHDAGQMLFAALHGAADTATFGLEDKASAALGSLISPLTGQPMSYDEAHARIQSNMAKLNGDNPVSSAIGQGAGMLIGAGKLAKLGKMIPGVGRLLEAAEPVAGQPVRNVLKSAALGGAASGAYTGADDAIRNGEVNPDNLVTNTAIGAAVAPAVSKIGTAIVKGVANANTRAMALLADKLGETPQVLQRAYDNFSAATGRVPTMAELVGMKSQGELRKLAQNNPIVQESVNNAADTAAAQRTRTLSQTVEDNSGGPAQDINQLTQARKDRMDTSMAPIRGSRVGIDTNDVGLLNDPRVRSAIRADPDLSGRVRDAIDNVATAGQDDSLTVNDIDSIRKSIRGRQSAYANPNNNMHNPHIARQFGNLADNIADLGTASEPGYADALSQFERDSNYIKGFKHGSAGKTTGEASDPDLIDALNSAEGRAGHQSGIATRTGDAAAASPDSAVRAAQSLAEGGGDTAALRGAVGQDSFSRMQRAGETEARGAEALQNISGRVQPEESGISGRHAAQTVAAAASHSPAGFLFHITRAIPSVAKQSPAVQRQIARYLADPSMTQQGINLLRKAGARDSEIKKLASALSASGGLNTAATFNE